LRFTVPSGRAVYRLSHWIDVGSAESLMLVEELLDDSNLESEIPGAPWRLIASTVHYCPTHNYRKARQDSGLPGFKLQSSALIVLESLPITLDGGSSEDHAHDLLDLMVTLQLAFRFAKFVSG
jgi:hypothetical protein